MGERQRELDELRRRQGEIPNHLIDEMVAGRLDRREFLRRGSVLGLGMPLMAAVLAACGDANDSSTTSQTTSGGGAATAPAKKGGTIRIGLAVPTAGLDPVKIADQGGLAVAGMAGEYLNQAQQNLSLRPQLAKRWTPSEDAKTWTFELQQGVKFHDGSPLTADDVVASFDRLTDPKGGSAALSAFQGVLSKGNIEARDPQTVVFHLDAANANFPYLVCSQIYNCVILPKNYQGDFEKTFNGTGPFKIKQYQAKQGATFVRNPDYWDKSRMPSLDTAVLRFYEGEQPQILALQGGQVDLLNQISFQGGRSLFGNPSYQIFPTRSAAHREIHMRVDQAPFKDKRVRQAIAYAIDRKAAVQGLFEGKADVGNDSPFWVGYPSTDKSVPQREQDLDKAKALLQAAGMSNLNATLTTERVGEIPDLAVLLQQAVRKIGGRLNLKIGTPTQYFGTGKPGETPWLEVPMGIVDYGHRPTPNAFLTAPLKTGGIWNAAHFSNKQYDALVQQYAGEVDVQKQQQISKQIQELLLDETPLIIPYFYNYLAAGSKKVQGYESDAQGLIDLRGTTLTA